MTAKQIATHAKETGRVWLGGEMEFPLGILCHEAQAIMEQIAENCGYLVQRRGMSMLSVVGGDVCGEIVLDWFIADRPGPVKIAVWSEEAAYLDTEEQHDEP